MRSAVHLSLAALLALPAIGCAQERRSAQNQERAPNLIPAQQAEPENAEPSRRLESVTWNSIKHELTWVISNGEKTDGSLYRAGASENYQISLDEATMSFAGETRRFSTEEASNVHVLMDLIGKYAVDSTVWWEDGQGEPTNGHQPQQQRSPAKPAPPADDDESVAVLRVASRTTSPVNLSALRSEIRSLEQKLADLKRLERSAASTDLTKD
ncbi:MAG TPA: hypothetical protein VN893_05850 [Bryobacteraceae bacterium]|nr:hypothetical protein [Bryobacteraceae bacterium]